MTRPRDFREHATPAAFDPVSDLLKNALVMFVIIVSVIGALAWANRVDEEARQYDAARRAEVEQQHARVRNAYQQGLSDAMASVRSTPSGVQLAQACRTLELGAQP